MTDEILARRLFKKQIRKELLDELRQFKVGWVHNGEMVALKNSGEWEGYIFVIPEEWFQGVFNSE